MDRIAKGSSADFSDVKKPMYTTNALKSGEFKDTKARCG
jgi:hypothetical protein